MTPLLTLVFTGPANAGITGLQSRYDAQAPPPADPVETAWREANHGISLQTFREWVALSQAECTPRANPASIALSVGIQTFNDPALDHDINTMRDMSFMAKMFTRKGVDQVHKLANPQHAELTQALTAMLRDSQCGDRMFISYAGSGLRIPTAQGFTSVLLARDSDSNCLLHAKDCEAPRTLTSDDLAALVTVARNRGITPVLFIDSCHGTDVASHTSEPVWTMGAQSPDPLRLHPGAADFAAFFAAGPTSTAMEIAGPDGQGGAFTFGLAQALSAQSEPSARTVGDAVSTFLRQAAPTQDPLIQASDPDITLFSLGEVPARGGIDMADNASIRLEGSKLDTRSSVPRLRAAPGTTVSLSGQVRPRKGLRHVRVGPNTIKVNRRGAFTATVSTPEPGDPLLVHAVFDDFSLHTTSIEVVSPADRHKIVRGEQYALLIGVQDYLVPGISDLSTPLSDIAAIGDVLTKEYGFRTTLTDEAGVAHSLVLKNPTQRTILESLERLVVSTQPDDHVLVYYAGHSEIPDGLEEAYWLPANADPRSTIDWVSADRVRAAIKRMSANSVLVVSDSCYSAKLTRALDPMSKSTIPPDERSESLVRLAEARSRLLISSGANEPVMDGGGSGYSVFARAFLDGLREQPESAFTTTELFAPLRERVVGNSAQEPQRLVYQGSGHDAGDFIFVRQ